MNVKNAIKKIVAVGAGLSMIGATVLGANLASYPAPFVEDGKFNGYIVVGAAAAAEDVVGAVDVASSLQYAIKKPASSDNTVVATSDEGVLIQKSSTDLDLNTGITDVYTKFTEDDLPNLLADGVYDETEGNNNNKVDYTQKLEFGANTNNKLIFGADDNNNDKADYYYHLDDNADFYTYTLTFETDVEHDGDSTSDCAADYENSKITFQGNEYTITDASCVDAGASDIQLDKLTLMAGDTTVWLREGDSVTRMVDGVEHTVEVSDVTENEDACGIYVDGSASPSWIDVGKTEVVNGLSIGIVNARAVNSQLQDSDVCEINVGADEIDLENGNKLKLDGTSVKGSNVAFTTADGTLSDISVTYEVDDDVYLADNSEWQDPLFGNFKVTFNGIVSDTEDMKLDVTSDEAEFTFNNEDGDEVSIPFYDTDEAGSGVAKAVVYGAKADEEFLVWEGINVAAEADGTGFYADDLTVADIDAANKIACTQSSVTAGNEAKSCEGALLYVVDGTVPHVLRIADIDVSGHKISIEDLTADKEYDDQDFTYAENTNNVLSLGSISTTLTLDIYASTASHYGILEVTDLGALPSAALSKLGATVDITGGVNTAMGINHDITIDDEDSVGTTTLTLADDTTDEFDSSVSVSAAMSSADGISADGDDEDHALYVDTYGTSVDENTDSEDIMVSYPDEQVYGLAFVAPVAASISESTTGAYTIEKINVGSAKLDSEVANVAAQNVLVVGGPCVNSVAREVMGRDMNNCADGFSEGVGMIKFLNNGNNVALVVAGYSAMDTRAATRVLANYADYDLSGSDMEVTYTDLSNVDVRAPMLE